MGFIYVIQFCAILVAQLHDPLEKCWHILLASFFFFFFFALNEGSQLETLKTTGKP